MKNIWKGAGDCPRCKEMRDGNFNYCAGCGKKLKEAIAHDGVTADRSSRADGTLTDSPLGTSVETLMQEEENA